MDEQTRRLVEAGRNVDLGRLPLWSGTKDSAFSAEQWAERIDKAKVAGNWTEVQTMSYVFNALRGDALTWFDALPTLGYDIATWDNFKGAFIRTYGTTKTARTAALNLSDIRQGSTEGAAKYMSRVIKIISDVKDLAPAHLPMPAQPFADEIRGLAGYNDIANNIKEANVQRLLNHGATDAYNRIGMQLFIAGLKPHLRVELMKSNPGTMREAFDAVIDAEKITAEPTRNKGATAVLAGISNEESDAQNNGQSDSDASDEEEGAEISALTAKIKALKKKVSAKKNKGNKGANKQSKSGSGQRPNGVGNKSGACRYCNKEGQFQAECYSRKAAGAPMVDAQGKPFKTGGVHAVAGANGYMHQQQQQQQQMHQQQQQQYNPSAHYTQGEFVSGGGGGAGVGAIWQKQPWEQLGGGSQSYNHLNY